MANKYIQVLPVAHNGRLHGIVTVDDLTTMSLTTAATVLIKTAKENLKRAR